MKRGKRTLTSTDFLPLKLNSNKTSSDKLQQAICTPLMALWPWCSTNTCQRLAGLRVMLCWEVLPGPSEGLCGHPLPTLPLQAPPVQGYLFSELGEI